MNEQIFQILKMASQQELAILDISGLGLSNLPAEIGKLVHLKELLLGHNQLTNLPPEIGDLINLERLDLNDNQLTQLPKEIRGLSSLKWLRVSRNNLTMLPSEIGELGNLEYLSLRENELTKLPKEIENLKKLEALSLCKNDLSSLGPEVGCFLRLKKLWLNDNELKDLPKEISQLQALELLRVENNPLLIPPEIVNLWSEPAKIIDYYFIHCKTRDTRPLREAKIIVAGQPEVGKTSLVRQVLHGTFNQNQTKTEGITINQWQLKGSKQDLDSQIKLNIWDFGGQEIMHTTHRFFLTKRSLYLLVLDSRLTQEENRVEYWLKIIQSFGGESPVLIVGNKIDQHPLDIDRTGLQKKYSNIVDVIETSAATGAGIEELKAAIREQIIRLPHIHDLLPQNWFAVKTALESLGRESNFITYDRYLELCAENEVSDGTNQRTLIGFLHDLGVILYFRDDPRLEVLGILNPQWVTNGVYKIINSHVLLQNRGELNISMLDEILNLPDYPHDKRFFIIDMMKKFELCFEIEADKTFLVPDLLPKDEPPTGKWKGALAFRYKYGVLPSSIISRFIVKMKDFIHQPLTWRSGTVLKRDINTALVKADFEDRTINIRVRGSANTRRDMLSLIRGTFEMIHKSITQLEVIPQVPHPQYPELILDYDELLEFERVGVKHFPRKADGKIITINVREMLNGIESDVNKRQEKTGSVTNFNIRISEKANVGNFVLASEIQNSFHEVETSSIQPELKEMLKQLAEAVDVMNKSLSNEQAAEAADDFSKLVDEATKPIPNKKWYSVSIEGLIKAAENVDKVGEPVIDLSRRVLSLLTSGVIK